MIDELFKRGQSFSNFPFRVMYLFPSPGSYVLQAGVTVSTRNFKKAVDRNRIKRLIREAYRLQKNILEEGLSKNKKCLTIFIIYTSNAVPEYQEIYNKMTHVLNRLNKIAEDNIITK